MCLGGSGRDLFGPVPINSDSISCSSKGEEVIVDGLGIVAPLCLFSCNVGLTRSGTSGFGLSLILLPKDSVLSPSVVTEGVRMLVNELLAGNAKAMPS